MVQAKRKRVMPQARSRLLFISKNREETIASQLHSGHHPAHHLIGGCSMDQAVGRDIKTHYP